MITVNDLQRYMNPPESPETMVKIPPYHTAPNSLVAQNLTFFKSYEISQNSGQRPKIEVFAHHKKAILCNRKVKKSFENRSQLSKSSDFHEIDNLSISYLFDHYIIRFRWVHVPLYNKSVKLCQARIFNKDVSVNGNGYYDAKSVVKLDRFYC